MSEKHYEEFETLWRGIKIAIRYCPSWSSAYEEAYGGPLSHLEVFSLDGSPMPISLTGYRSRFDQGGLIYSDFGNISDFVIAWLDHEAKSQLWQEHRRDSMQLTLF